MSRPSPALASLFLADETGTEQLGQALASAIKTSAEGLVVFLEGDLGMGKTTLSRGLIRGLGHQGAVKSPTFTLVEPYEHLDPLVYHFDLYRLGDPEELEYMGVRDYFQPGQVCLIEWPERGRGVLPPADLKVRLNRQDQGRIAELAAGTQRGQRLLAQLRLAPGAGQKHTWVVE